MAYLNRREFNAANRMYKLRTKNTNCAEIEMNTKSSKTKGPIAITKLSIVSGMRYS